MQNLNQQTRDLDVCQADTYCKIINKNKREVTKVESYTLSLILTNRKLKKK